MWRFNMPAVNKAFHDGTTVRTNCSATWVMPIARRSVRAPRLSFDKLGAHV